MQELLVKRKHLFFLHFFTNYCESQRTHMIIFCVSQAQISAHKTRFAPKISSDIQSAAGELFIGPSQSLLEMSDGPTAIGEHYTAPSSVCQHFQTSSPLKPLGQLNSNLYGDSLGRGNESLFKWSWSHDQDGHDNWLLPCPYMVKTL